MSEVAPWYYPPEGWSTRTPKLDLNSSLDVASINGSNLFTSVTANWAAGQVLVVRGAGTSSGVYTGVIQSVQQNSGFTTAVCNNNAATTGSSLQAFWGSDDTVAWQTQLNAAAPGTIVDGPPNFATLIQQRLDTGTYTNGSSTVTDVSITAADAGKWVMSHPTVTNIGSGVQSWTGIPVGSFVGSPVPGVGFTLVNASGQPVAATANGSSVSLSIGGLYIPSFIQLCPETSHRSIAPEVSATVPGISVNIRNRGRLFGIVQCASLSGSDGGAAGSLAWSSPNAMFGLTSASSIGGSITAYSVNQVSYLASTPTTFAPIVGVVTPNAGGWFIGSVFLPNAYWGIQWQGGPGHIAHPVVGGLNVAFIADHCYDYVHADHLEHGVWWDYVEGVTFNPGGAGSTALDAYAMNNSSTLVMGRCDAFHINGLSTVISSTGIVFGTSPDSNLNPNCAYGTVDRADIDQACSIGINAVAAPTGTAQIISSLMAGGNAQSFGPHQSGTGATAVMTTAATARLVVKSWALRIYATNSSNFTGATLVIPGANPG